MFYLASYAFFLSALAAYFRERKAHDAFPFSSFCAIMVGFGQYALVNARKFEQAMMPVGCMLFFLGALIYFVMQPGALKLLWLTWSFGFFTGCYTPGIAGWVHGPRNPHLSHHPQGPVDIYSRDHLRLRLPMGRLPGDERDEPHAPERGIRHRHPRAFHGP